MDKIEQNKELVREVLFQAFCSTKECCLNCRFRGHEVSSPPSSQVKAVVDGLKGLGLDPNRVVEAVRTSGKGEDPNDFDFHYDAFGTYGSFGTCISPESFIEVVAELLP